MRLVDKEMRQKTIKGMIKWLLLILLVLGCNLFVARLAIVFGPSMEPTLQQYDFLVVWQLGYTPEKGDIVVTTADNPLQQNIIKRIVAVEGETISFERNGEAVTVTVPKGQVFLMGDNREHSTDSRELGCFAVEDICGKAVARIFPFTKITILD